MQKKTKKRECFEKNYLSPDYGKTGPPSEWSSTLIEDDPTKGV